MVRRGLTVAALAACACVLVPGASAAQTATPHLPRADVSLSVGWLHAQIFEMSNTRDDWASQRATLGAQAGLYWTEHIKTEITVERSTTQTMWEGVDVSLTGGVRAWRSAEHAVQDTRVSIGQFYQFGHNAWAHVALGAGVAVTGRSRSSDFSPLVFFDRAGERTLESGYSESVRSTETRAFAAVVSKAYVTPRVFIRAELQTDFESSLDAVVMRVGVGVDF